MTPVERVLAKLEGVEQRGGGHRALCPGHEDVNPSLSISEGNAGQALLHCHAGCRKEAVLQAIGLHWKDLYPPEAQNGHHKRRSWEIRDADGVLIAIHHRRETPDGKRMWWRGPNGEKTLSEAGLKISDLPLYRSEHIQSWPNDVPVVVVEGELAGDALAAVYPATLATATGAESVPGAAALEALRGCKVILWPDADEPGRKHMQRVATALQGVASEVRIFEWKDAWPKSDAADHPVTKDRSRAGVEELLEALAKAPVFSMSPSPSLIHVEGRGRSPFSTPFNEIPEPGTRRYHLDGLVPEGFPVMLYGDGAVAKSLLALSLALTLSRGGEKWLGHGVGDRCGALFMDFELDSVEQRRRVNRLARGDGLDRLPDDLRYMSALGYPPRDAFGGALEACKRYGLGFLVLDSLGVALQGDVESARDVIGFFQKTLEPFRAAGVTVLIVDHMSRLQAGERYQSKGAFGSVYKSNLARSVIQAEAVERGEGTLTVRLRQKKHSFGELTTLFEAKFTFSEERIALEPLQLRAAALADEGTLNAIDRVRLALKAGPAFPAGIAEGTGLALKTVKNKLSELRKTGIVIPTGRVEDRAEEVSLASSPHIRDGDGDTRSAGHVTRLVYESMSPEWIEAETLGKETF